MWFLTRITAVLALATSVWAFTDYYDYNEPSSSVGSEQALDEHVYGDYGDYGDYGNGYAATRTGMRNRGHETKYHYRYYNKPNMQKYQKSYGYQKPEKIFVPVVIKKKKQKKRKTISVHSGFYVPGGTQMFGKFKDLHSCKKACEITPTCFSGDFNPWLGKCYLHSNLTACGSMRAHKAVTHFKKIPCTVLETPRGFVALGVSVINGIEIKGIKSLSDCIKKCATAGGGIASVDSMVIQEGQVCCHLDYDFGNHKCYFHTCGPDGTMGVDLFCYNVPSVTNPPINSIANPSSISITLCPRADV